MQTSSQPSPAAADEDNVHVTTGVEPSEQTRFVVPQRIVSLTLLVTLAYGALAQGGFHARDYRQLLLLVAGTSAMALLAGLRPRVGSWIVAAAFLALSTVLSAFASASLASALPTLALLGAMAAVTSIVDRLDDEGAVHVSLGLTMVGVLVAATAWIGVAFRHEPWGRISDGLWRGSSSITYSNAAASLVGATMLMAVARVVGTRRDGREKPSAGDDAAREVDGSRSADLVSGLALFALMSGLLVTQSRAGIAATALGGLILALRLGVGRVLSVVLLPGVAALVSSGIVVSGSSVETDGRPFPAVASLVVGALIVTAGTAAAATRRSRGDETRRGAAAVVAVLGLGLIAVVGLIVSDDNAFADIVERRLTLSSNTAAGEVVFFGDRSHEWKAAVDQFRGRPLLGVGPEQLRLRWTEADGSAYSATYVHNEYLELAATHGILGLIAATLGAALVVDEIRRRRHATPLAERWGAYAALITVLAHSGLDFLWHLPLLPIVMSAIVGLLVRNRGPSVPSA